MIVEQHLNECGSCRDFMAWMSNLGQFAEVEPVSEEKQRDVIKSSVDMYYKSRAKKRGIGAISLSAAAIAAAILFFVLMPKEGVINRQIESSKSCLASAPSKIAPGIWLTHCDNLAPDVSFDSIGNLTVSIETGTVGISADPDRRDKHGIRVKTPFGTARVLGTVFTVKSGAEDARVEVFRGKVQVRGGVKKLKSFVVPAGYGAWFSKGRSLEIENRESNQFYGQLMRAGEKASLTNREVIDEQHIVNDKNALLENSESRQADTDGPRGKRNSFYVNSLKGNAKTVKNRRVALDGLIQDARNCLIDQNWKCAAVKYNNILTGYNDQWEASTALVSLAKIELRHLGKSKEALKHYKLYMKKYPKGALIEEAIFGIAESYRRQGNEKMELATLRRFIAEHSGSPSVAKAKERISEIEQSNKL
jgi:TolA-binding protein